MQHVQYFRLQRVSYFNNTNNRSRCWALVAYYNTVKIRHSLDIARHSTIVWRSHSKFDRWVCALPPWINLNTLEHCSQMHAHFVTRFSIVNGNRDSASAFPNLLPFLYSIWYEYIAKKIAQRCSPPFATGMLFCPLAISFNGWWSGHCKWPFFPKNIFVQLLAIGKHDCQRFSTQLCRILSRLCECKVRKQNWFVLPIDNIDKIATRPYGPASQCITIGLLGS